MNKHLKKIKARIEIEMQCLRCDVSQGTLLSMQGLPQRGLTDMAGVLLILTQSHVILFTSGPKMAEQRTGRVTVLAVVPCTRLLPGVVHLGSWQRAGK